MTDQHEGRIAVRAYAVPEGFRQKGKRVSSHTPWPELTLVLDCSTTRDASARLSYGAYLVLNGQRLIDRGFFYADDLPLETLGQLQDCCLGRNQELETGEEDFRILTRDQFIQNVFLKVGCRGRGVIVGFNLPSQISRIALDWAEARAGIYKGGFSFTLLTYKDQDGVVRPHAFAPRIAVKSIDGRRALIGFTSAWQQDPRSGGEDKNKKRPPFRGHFVDCRVLAFALSGKYFDIDSACDYFAAQLDFRLKPIATGNVETEIHTLEVRIERIGKLYQRLLKDYSQHPISLPPDQAYSGASLGKAYLRGTGIKPPPLQISKALNMTSEEVLGAAMVSYFGARAECWIRRLALPVAYLDFLSMYPTVHSLMGMWEFLVARSIDVEDWTRKAERFLKEVTPEMLFTRSTWNSLTVLVKVLPENDVMPIRTKYSRYSTGGNTLAVNEVSSPISLWYTLADCIASKLLTGKAPKVIKAIRFEPRGVQKGLNPVNILGRCQLDPEKDDYFKALVELRYRLKNDPTLEQSIKDRLNDSLKTIVNAISYGIFIELNRQEGEESTVQVYGLENFKCEVETPEEPGEFFFPIVGTFLTGGARLMLALLEHEITQRGGSYVFMDTDSAAVVASKDGGLIPCPGGPERMAEDKPAVKALRWTEVDELLHKFDRLNPYDWGDDIPGILKLEDENFINLEPRNEQIELQCLAISTKRYALYYKEADRIHIQKASEHGLGNYLAPLDPDKGVEVEDWIEHAWLLILRPDSYQRLRQGGGWLGSFVHTRIQLSTPGMMEWITPLNTDNGGASMPDSRDYATSLKPFNFIEHIPVSSMMLKLAQREETFCLISPASELLPTQRKWVNIRDQNNEVYWIRHPHRKYLDGRTLTGLTFRELIDRHGQQPESKFLSNKGENCRILTRGLLIRRKVKVAEVLHIGKEANEIDKVQAGLVDSEDEVLLTYEKDLWETMQPILAKLPTRLILDQTGYSRSMVYALKSGERRPSTQKLEILIALVSGLNKVCCEANLQVEYTTH
jgi:hypothetical protein